MFCKPIKCVTQYSRLNVYLLVEIDFILDTERSEISYFFRFFRNFVILKLRT